MKSLLAKKRTAFIALLFTFIFALCSCSQAGEAASKLIDAVVSSAGEEISSALSDGMEEFSEGMEEFSDGLNEIKEGITEASSGLENAGDVISEHIGNIADDIGSRISDELGEIPENIKSAESSVSEKIEDIAGNIGDKIGSELSEAADKITPQTSASSDDTTKTPAENKQYTFRSKKLYDEHFKKHGAEFGDITKEKYLELANELINSDSDRVLHKDSADGDHMYFDQDTEYFLVLSDDGYIRTFFIPSAGIKYWNRQ